MECHPVLAGQVGFEPLRMGMALPEPSDARTIADQELRARLTW